MRHSVVYDGSGRGQLGKVYWRVAAAGRGAGHAKRWLLRWPACVMWAAVQGHARRVERPAPGISGATSGTVRLASTSGCRRRSDCDGLAAYECRQSIDISCSAAPPAAAAGAAVVRESPLCWARLTGGRSICRPPSACCCPSHNARPSVPCSAGARPASCVTVTCVCVRVMLMFQLVLCAAVGLVVPSRCRRPLSSVNLSVSLCGRLMYTQHMGLIIQSSSQPF